MLSLFESVQQQLDEEGQLRDQIREEVKPLDATARTLTATLSRIHSPEPQQQLAAMCESVLTTLQQDVAPGLQRLNALVPPGQYYRFCEHWTRTLQQLCFICALIVFLQHHRLITCENIQRMLGVPVNAPDTDGFQIPIEEFLHGLVSLSNELARLAVTSVIKGDMEMPLELANFVDELHRGFQQLNLKNDMLRKRFDSMKYDMKKIEEVVYNVKLRGLVQQGQPE